MSRKYFVAGNWKMNGSLQSNQELLDGLKKGGIPAGVDVAVCPSPVHLSQVGAAIKGSGIALGAQNLCDQEQQGAFTGEVHGGMLHELGCRYVIVGHSERRALYGESSEQVAEKFRIAQLCNLVPILCVGETLEAREGGNTEAVLAEQLGAVVERCGVGAFVDAVIAYEPVWAIGTGKTASPQQAQDAHAFLRAQLAQRDAKIAASVQILYGGSVKPGNAAELFACEDVDGGLIGGAALNAEDFLAICKAAAQ